MAEKKVGRGGSRKGAGRPQGARDKLKEALESRTLEHHINELESIDTNTLDVADKFNLETLDKLIYTKLVSQASEGENRAITTLLDRYLKKAPVKAQTPIPELDIDPTAPPHKQSQQLLAEVIKGKVSLEAAMLCKELIVTNQNTVAREVEDKLSIRANSPDYKLRTLNTSDIGFTKDRDSYSWRDDEPSADKMEEQLKRKIDNMPNFIPDSMYSNSYDSRSEHFADDIQKEIEASKQRIEQKKQEEKVEYDDYEPSVYETNPEFGRASDALMTLLNDLTTEEYYKSHEFYPDEFEQTKPVIIYRHLLEVGFKFPDDFLEETAEEWRDRHHRERQNKHDWKMA